MHKRFADRIADIYIHKTKKHGEDVAKKWAVALLKNNTDDVRAVAASVKEKAIGSKKAPNK